MKIGAPRGTLLRAASPRRGARGGCGGLRAPRRGDPADQRAWRRRRKRQHRGALRPGPRGRGGGWGPAGAGPRGAPPLRPRRGRDTIEQSLRGGPGEVVRRRGARAAPRLPREEPVSPVALLEFDLPLSDRVGLSFAYLPIIARKRVQDEVSSFPLSSLLTGVELGFCTRDRPPPILSTLTHTPFLGNAAFPRVQL